MLSKGAREGSITPKSYDFVKLSTSTSLRTYLEQHLSGLWLSIIQRIQVVSNAFHRLSEQLFPSSLYTSQFGYTLNFLFGSLNFLPEFLQGKQLLFCLFQLSSQTSHCLLIAFVCLLQLNLCQSQFFHRPFGLRLVVVKPCFSGPQLRL